MQRPGFPDEIGPALTVGPSPPERRRGLARQGPRFRPGMEPAMQSPFFSDSIQSPTVFMSLFFFLFFFAASPPLGALPLLILFPPRMERRLHNRPMLAIMLGAGRTGPSGCVQGQAKIKIRLLQKKPPPTPYPPMAPQDRKSQGPDPPSPWRPGFRHSTSSTSSDLSRLSHTLPMSQISDPIGSSLATQSPLFTLAKLLRESLQSQGKSKLITKEKLFAHMLYADDIDFVLVQKSYIRDSGARDYNLGQAEPVREIPPAVAGYKIVQQLSQIGQSSLVYKAIHEETGECVIVKLSQDAEHADYTARFLNEWYLTSGLQPAPDNRLWAVDVADPKVLDLPSTEVRSLPLTLPRDIPGILYPVKELNVVNDVRGSSIKLMALIYPDYNYKTIGDYYAERTRELLSDKQSLKSSLRSGSILSGPSEQSGWSGFSSDSLGSFKNTDYIELSNKVKQLPKGPSLVIEILNDMVAVIKLIRDCHKRGIVHNGITSHSVLRSSDIMPKTDPRRISLINWDFSFSIAVEDSSSLFRNKNLNSIQNLVHYMSPETSGASISAVDYRSDFYSLGVVLYELIVGCLPLRSDNLLSFRRMLVNQKPIQPRVLGPKWISDDLNYVIMKCLEKNPSDRYNDAARLIEDLQNVIISYTRSLSLDRGRNLFDNLIDRSPGKISLFYPSVFKFVNAKAHEKLYEAMSSDDPSKLIQLEGEYGVGTSVLLELASGQAFNKQEFVIHWKYHCSNSNATRFSSAMYGVFAATKQILGSSEEVINEWRNILTTEIDADLGLLFHAVPSLQTLLGTQYNSIRRKLNKNIAINRPIGIPVSPGAIEDDDMEPDNENVSNDPQISHFSEQELNTELKYIYIFKTFFSLLARKGLTVILDSLNNCPADEFEFIEESLQFCYQKAESRLTVIASRSWRPSLSRQEANDFSSDILEKLAKSISWPLHKIDVDRLDKQCFENYIDSAIETMDLPYISQHLFAATKGNLLSLKYILRHERLAGCDGLDFWSGVSERCRKRANGIQLRDGVAMYLKAALPDSVKEILKFAALSCRNGIFSMSDLMIVSGLGLEEIHRMLHIAVETRVIKPNGICYKLPFHLFARDDFTFDIDDSLVWDLATKCRFGFDHDVIQLFLLDEMKEMGEIESFHKMCGLRLKRKLSKEVDVNLSAYLVMASHLYESRHLAFKEDYRHYNEALITAGRYAISTSNVPLALRYFTAAEAFLHVDDKRRAMKLTLTKVQCNYLLKDYEESIRIIHQAESDFGKDNLTLLHLKVCALFKLKEFKQGMTMAINGLRLLNIEVSEDMETCKALAEKHFLQLPLSVAEIRNLKKAKPARSKRFMLICGFIQDIINPTYILDLADLRLAALSQLITLMNKHGYLTSCAIPLLHMASYFALPGSHMSMLKASELADVALSLVNNDKGASTPMTQSINETYSILMAQFKHPITKILKSANVMDQPDRNASQNFFIKNWVIANSLLLGNLRGWTASSTSLKKQVSFSSDEEQLLATNTIALWRGHVKTEDYIEQVRQMPNKLSPDIDFIYSANAIIKASLEQNLNLACEIIFERGFELLKKLPLSILHVWFYFMSTVCLLNSTDESTLTKRLALAREIGSYFKIWATTCYDNFATELKIIEACLMIYDPKEDSLHILDMFEDAIQDAENQQQWLAVAMANRLCAKWLKKTGQSRRRISQYASRAHALYVTMNTKSQAQLIKKDFPEISETFNWAGVRDIADNRVAIENPNFFDNRLKGADRLPLRKELSIDDDSQSFVSQSNAIPKLNNVRSMQKATAKEPTHIEWTEAIKLCLSISESSSLDLIVQTLLESTLMFSGVDYGAVILNLHSDEPVIKALGTVNNIYLLDDEKLSTRTDLVPYKLVIQCLIHGEIICKDKKRNSKDAEFMEDSYYASNQFSAGLCVPIKTSTVIGVIYLESHVHSGLPDLMFPLIESTKIDLLYLLCSQAAVSFSKSVVYTQMELAKKVAEEATDEKASFLANMSHEIRTPFNSLFACSIFLLDTDLNAIQKEYVETIKDSALVTLNIIDGILAFTKIEHGSFNLESETFSINDTIEGAILFSSEHTESDNFEFAYFNNCPQIEEITGDATRVRQIIINLVGNAIKFTKKGFVKVVLDAKMLTEGRYELSLTVEDTGIGIPDDSKDKVFGAFSQVDGSSRRVYGGSGLGLAISNKLAEIMNGTISFTSKEGEGSLFSFRCPFAVKLAESAPQPISRSVCIISHTKWKKKSIKEVMEYYGAKVSLVSSLKEYQKDRKLYDIIMVEKILLKPGIKLRSTLNNKSAHIYVMTRFGLVLTDEELNDIEADSLVFSPLKRSTIRRILEEKYVAQIADTKPKTLKSGGGERAKSPAMLESSALRILLAEDNPVNLRVASQHLKKMGYKADHAKDGVEVLEKCEELLKEKKKYDVILMDIQMPRKDGIQATEELKESFTLRNLEEYLPKIIALTANVAGEERARCIACGMVDFITKPILPDMLKKALLKVTNDTVMALSQQ